jgi:hypothetical protein
MKRSIIAIVAASLVAFGAYAQQASGGLMGAAKSGDTVTVTGMGTGFHRELKIDEDGKWQIRQVPLGNYKIEVAHADGSSEKPKAIAVRAGTTARVK